MKPKLLRIESPSVQDWLMQHGIQPVRTWYEVAYFEGTPQVLSLLESYNIRKYYFKNKFER